MPVATQTVPPSCFTAGDTLIFSVSGTEYPATAWTMTYTVSRLGQVLFTVTAAADGNDFLFTVPKATTAITPGPANWAIVATEISTTERKRVSAGVVSVIYDPTVNLALTTNQTLLAQCNTAIGLIAASGNRKVDINGQMFERNNLSELIKLRDRLQAAVNDELRAMGIQTPGGAIILQTRF